MVGEVTHYSDRRPWAEENTRVETVDVPEHQTPRLTIKGDRGLGMGAFGGQGGSRSDWVFTFASTGCLRVQRGDFCAYVPVEALDVLADFIKANSTASRHQW